GASRIARSCRQSAVLGSAMILNHSAKQWPRPSRQIPARYPRCKIDARVLSRTRLGKIEPQGRVRVLAKLHGFGEVFDRFRDMARKIFGAPAAQPRVRVGSVKPNGLRKVP